MHRADPFGVYQTRGAGMMHECSPGESPTGTAFMHHGNKGYHTLKHSVAIKELNHMALGYARLCAQGGAHKLTF